MAQRKGLVVDHGVDPVFVEDSPSSHTYVVLRIGEPKPGQSRIAHLVPSKAKLVAYALLAAAERVSNDE